MNESGKHPHDDDLVGRLLTLAGEPEPIPEEVVTRARSVVASSWRQQVMRRKRWQRGWLAAAAAAVLSAGLARWMIQPEILHGGEVIASVQRLSGAGAVLRGGRRLALAEGAELLRGDTLESDAHRLALDWASGHGVRINANTKVELQGPDRLELDHGQLYVQGPGHSGPLTVITAAGPVRDIGTQFMVTAQDSEVDIKVREGEVSIVRASGEVASVTEGYGLTLVLADERSGAASNAEPRPLDNSGEEWDWAFEIAPVYDIDGKTPDDFVRWLAREKNWRVAYGSRAARRAANNTVLKGRLQQSATAEQWLENALRQVGLRFDLQGRTLRIDLD